MGVRVAATSDLPPPKPYMLKRAALGTPPGPQLSYVRRTLRTPHPRGGFIGPFETDVHIESTAPGTAKRLPLGFADGMFRFSFRV